MTATVQILVRTLEGKTKVLRMHPSASILEVVECAVNWGPLGDFLLDKVYVTHHGRRLELDSTLKESRVGNQDCLHLTSRLKSTYCPHAHSIVSEFCYLALQLQLQRPGVGSDAIQNHSDNFKSLSTAFVCCILGSDPTKAHDLARLFLDAGCVRYISAMLRGPSANAFRYVCIFRYYYC